MSRIVAITGAGAGLGRAIARRLAQEGDRLALLGRRLEPLQTVCDELGVEAVAVQCDVALPESVNAAFASIKDRFGSLDVLVNNAAVYEPFVIAEARDDQILGILHTNLAGPMFTSRAAIPLMARGGHIVNLSSESVVKHFPMLSLYQSSKAGLERFSVSLGAELRGQGIRVTALRAGMMYDEDKTSSGWAPEVAMRFAKACMEAGIDLRGQPKSHFDGVARVIGDLLRLPADVAMPVLQLEGFAQEPRE